MEKRIEIDGKLYPCYMTIGAMMAFKKMTGKEVDDMVGLGIEGVATLFFCCIRGACRREKMEFPFSTAEELADFIRPQDLSTWEKSIAGEGSPGDIGKKKRIEIEKLAGVALGIMGISLDDLERLTPGEFNAAHEARVTLEEFRYRADWERSRYVSYHCVVPHAKKGFRITDLGRFPWEERVLNVNGPVKKLLKEDRERMKKKFGIVPVTLHVPDTFPQEHQNANHDTGD